jgi:hypothetical protein
MTDRTRIEIAGGLRWRAKNLRRSASENLAKARELEQCADEMLTEKPGEELSQAERGEP